MKNRRIPPCTAVAAATATLCFLAITPASQAQTWDLAADWALEGKDLSGMPFGPDHAWGVYRVDCGESKWTWTAFNRPMHFTISNPWYRLYNIDGWWLGETPMRRKPMLGKNAGSQLWGPGNIPGTSFGVQFDWPVNRVAGCSWPDEKGKTILLAAAWTAPGEMKVSVQGGVWTAGKYLDVAQRRTRTRLWIDRAANKSGPADEILLDGALVPIWTEGVDSSHPRKFSEFPAGDAAALGNISVAQGDRVCVGFYWDEKATKPGINGIDLQITRK